MRLLPSHPVATDPRPDLVLTPLGAEARPLSEWLTTFHLASVVLDPYTNESSWILPTARRILEGLRGSDARVNFVVTAPEADARAFMGPLVEEFLVFVDPDRQFVKQLGLAQLPAFVFVRVDNTVPAAAEGGIRTSGGPWPRRSWPRRPGRRPTSRSSATPARSTARRRWPSGRLCQETRRMRSIFLT